jgi:hypothetical protein
LGGLFGPSAPEKDGENELACGAEKPEARQAGERAAASSSAAPASTSSVEEADTEDLGVTLRLAATCTVLGLGENPGGAGAAVPSSESDSPASPASRTDGEKEASRGAREGLVGGLAGALRVDTETETLSGLGGAGRAAL